MSTRSRVIDNFIAYLTVERNLSQNTVKLRKYTVGRFIRWLEDRPLNLYNCRQFIYYLRNEGLEASSVNRYIDSIKIYSEYLSRTNQSLLEIKNLKRLQEKPSLPDYFTLDEMRSLLACELGHDKYGLRERYSLFFSCMAYMGLRFSEVAKLTPNHFAHQQNHFYVHIRDGKTGDRTILVPSRLWTLLAAYMKNYLRPKTYLLFVTRRGSAITHYSATEELRKRCIKLGIDESRARTHNFRHGFCTEAARAGFTSLQLKPITGHKRLETLEKYVHLSGHDTKIIESHPLNN